MARIRLPNNQLVWIGVTTDPTYDYKNKRRVHVQRHLRFDPYDLKKDNRLLPHRNGSASAKGASKGLRRHWKKMLKSGNFRAKEEVNAQRALVGLGPVE